MTKNQIQKETSVVTKKVLHYFFSFPEKFIGLNELSGIIKSSKTSTKSTVNQLIKEDFLKKETIGNIWRISLNQKNPKIITKKIPYNLELIYESDIISKVYNKIPEARTIILFGSYRWGTDNENSDIDIAVEVLDKQKMKIEELITLENLSFKKNIKVNLHIFSRSNINLNLFTNIANGIVLDGLLEVKP